MGSQVCVRILQRTWKTNLLKCGPMMESPMIWSFFPHRTLCSSGLDPPASPLSTQHPKRDLTKQSLADLGFSESQAETMYEAVIKHNCKHDLPVLTVLFGLGLNPGSVLNILNKCPELYSCKKVLLEQRITNLRKFGLLEGSLQRVISHYPKILTFPVKRVASVVRLLREKCIFTAQQVSSILRDSPHIVEEDLTHVEYMFQYVYYRMGCQQAEMVKAKLFRFTLEELQCRHGFLERRGLYQTPDKKGQTLVLNPTLKDILAVTEEIFVSKVAAATQEEFDVFRKLIAREKHEEDYNEAYSSDNDRYSDEEEEEDDDDDDDDGDKVDHTQKHIGNSLNKGK